MGLLAASLYALVSVAGAEKSVSDLQRVSGQVNKTHASLGGVGKSLGQVGKGFGQVGTGLLRVGATAGAVALSMAGAASKIGMDFEDAFAGVRKTVEGSEADLNGLFDELKKLSTRIPVKFTDLADIAQEAGALGVARKDIAGFTEDVARLSAATVGLTPGAAAEAFGKLGNVLHQHGKDYERMGSSLIALGNAGASSEGDIVEVAKRFGAAGAAAKLTAAQVLGFSSAIASLGVEPEAAGSSLSRLFNNITKYIATGSDKVKTFAKVSGVSVKQFSDLYRKDAAGGVELFLQKLGKLDRFAASRALKAAGITNVRDINAVLLLSQNYGELKRQVDLSTQAYKDNTELQAVSEKRFDTFKNHLRELANTALAGADSFSQGLNPALDRLAQKAKTFVGDHTADFKKLGSDLGAAIDKIDWKQVQAGANTLVDIFKVGLAVLEKIPVQIDAAILALAGANKLSGGLVGQGLGNIAQGGLGLLGNLARPALSKVPKVGGILGQIGSAPVYITGIAPGVSLGGLGGGGAAGAGALGAGGLLGKIGKVISGVFVVTLAAEIADAIHGAISPGGGLEGREATGTQLPTDQLSWPWGPKNTPKIMVPLPWGGEADLLAGSKGGGAMNRMTYTPPVYGPPKPPDSAIPDHGETRSIELASQAATKANTEALRKATAATAKQSLHTMLAGIHARSAAKFGGHGLGEAAVHATLLRQIGRTERDILRGHGSTDRKIERLKDLQAIAVANKDWGVARKIGADLRSLRPVIAPINIDGRKIASVVLRYQNKPRVT